MSAQSDFLLGMQGFRLAREHKDIVDKSPDELAHNLRAKALRNGIAIVGFSVLEHFLRARTGELLDRFDQVSTPFDKLPELLRSAATHGALKGILARAKYSDDSISFVQSEAKIVESSASKNFKISKYSLGYESSNLSADEVSTIFKTFKINAGWTSISKLSNKLNLTIPDSKSAYKNASARRHDAAHNINASVNPSDLESYVRESYAISIGFDMLVSEAFSRIYDGDEGYLKKCEKISHEHIDIRTLKYSKGKWCEVKVGGKRATKTGASTVELWDDALARAEKRNEVLVELDMAGYPLRWEFPSIV